MHFSNAGPLHIEIGEYAFFKCRSLAHIVIPPAVRVIKYANFFSCLRSTTMILSVGMEEIGERSFKECAFVRINIPPSVRAIKEGAFKDCSWLTTAILNNGLEEIGKQAFKECVFVRINIPSAVREIDEMAFKDCSNLVTVRFCNEIEEFMSGGPMQDWWNHRVHEKCLSTYIFLVRFNILQCLGLVQSTTLQTNIDGMLEHIPSISPKGLNAFVFVPSIPSLSSIVL